MTLRSKLLLTQVPLVVVLVAGALFAVGTLATIATRSRGILGQTYRSVLAAQRMEDSLERIDDASLMLLEGQRERARARTLAPRQRFEQELEVARDSINEPGEREAVRRLGEAWDAYKGQLERYEHLTDREEMRRYYFGVLEPAFRTVQGAVVAVLGLNQDAMVRRSDWLNRYAVRARRIVLVGAVLALAVGLFASTTLMTGLLRPLSTLAHGAQRIAAGDVQARADASGHDELAQVARGFNVMAEQLAHYQKSSLGQLLQAQQASQEAIDRIPDPVVIFGKDGTILSVNQASTALLGLGLEAEVADPLEHLEPQVREMLERVRGYVLEGRGSYQPAGFEEAVRVATEGGDRYFLPRAEPVYGEREGIIGVTVVLQDVTRLRWLDELKNNLVATVAHEFGTPLMSLRMAIHVFLEQAAGPINERQAELLAGAREDCERLESIVDGLLDLAWIQAGRRDLQPRPESVFALVRSTVDGFRTAAEERGLELTADVAPVFADVLADAEHIRIVFSNLITNAIRHTPAGGRITLAARQIGEQVRFEVRDTGEGVPKALQGAIFERFFRVPGAKSGRSGLGLSISQEIVRAHGGEIGVESEPGRGSTFWFTLPVAPETGAAV